MLTTSMLLMYLGALVVAYIMPGPDMLLVLATGAGQGRRAALYTALGLAASRSVHALLAALGISALLAASPLAFDVMRYAGACYMLWLAWQSLQQGAAPVAASPGGGRFWPCFRKGLLTNLLNPKVIIFCSLLLPQFVVVEQGAVLLQFLVLGILLVLVGFVMDCGFAIGASRLARGTKGRAGAALQKWLFSSVFAGLALRLLLLENAAGH